MLPIGVRYADGEKIPAVVRDIEKMLCAHPGIDQNRVRLAKLDKFGPSSLELLLHCFTIPTQLEEFRAVQQDVLLKVLEIIKSHGARCAFPTTTLLVPGGVEVRSPHASPQSFPQV